VSANTGTWTNSITLNGDVTLSGLGGRLVLSGSTSGTANVTKSGANEVTISNPGYTGNTTVAAGTLTVGGAGLDDEGEIVIAAGAILNLSHDATDVVDTLLLGGVPAAPGTWGSPTSDADNKNDVYFQGDGILDVRNTAVVPSGYATWIAAFPLEGDDTLPGSDPDHDGLQNAVERVIGGNPSISSQQGRPTGAIDGTDLVFTFNREDASETADTLVEVEYGNDLAGWTAVTIGAASEGIVKVEENDGDPDLITVSIPLDGDTERFARLKVTVTSD
jgi:autotransporter-associated beta strand protein